MKKKLYNFTKYFIDRFRALNFFFKDFKSLTFVVSLIGLGFFGCVSIWDSHLDKMHLMEIELLEKKKSIEIDVLEKDQEVVNGVGYYLLLTVTVISIVALAYACFDSDSVDYSVLHERVKNMDIVNFSKIEVMQKQVQTLFPKVLTIESQVFDLHSHMENIDSMKGLKTASHKVPTRDLFEDIFTVDHAANDEDIKNYQNNS